MKHFETIERYLDGEMTPNERQAFEAALASDPELREEFEAVQYTVKGLRDLHEATELKARMQRLEREIHAEESGQTNSAPPLETHNPSRKSTWRPQWFVAAAFLAAAAIALIWLIWPSKHAVDPNLLPQEMGLPVLMGSTRRFDAAMVQFREGNYDESADLLRTQPDAKQNDTIRYYLGLCELRQGHLKESKEYFNDFPQQSAYAQRVQFYEGLIAYETGEFEAARTKLDRIASQDTTEFGAKARLILSKIDGFPKQ